MARAPAVAARTGADRFARGALKLPRAATIKARWICEQAHQQLKEELGLDHFEGRFGRACIGMR
jgi:hypothetical protein